VAYKNEKIALLLTKDESFSQKLSPSTPAMEETYINFVAVNSVEEAFLNLEEGYVDLITIDLSSPVCPGLESFERIKSHAPDIAIVIIVDGSTDHCQDEKSEQIIQKTIHQGADDFLEKNNLDTQQLNHTLRLVLERRQARRHVDQLAYHDSLTGLPNRTVFLDRLEQSLFGAKRYGDLIAVYFIDLDRFKWVNDNLGHSAGDELLQLVAHRLQDCVRSIDTVARIGGDEFAIVQTRINNADRINAQAQRIVDGLSAPFNVANRKISISCSIGISLFPKDGTQADKLLANADVALRSSKESGRRTHHFFDQDLQAAIQEEEELAANFKQALDRDEFEIHYQPQKLLQENAIICFEALARWHHPTRGTLKAHQFLPALEKMNLVLPFSEMVFNLIEKDLHSLCQGNVCHNAISINVSLEQVTVDGFCSRLKNFMDRSNLLAHQVELELPERTFIQERGPEFGPVLQDISRMGVHIVMDNFALPFGMVVPLRRNPISKIKVSQTLIQNIGKSEDDETILKAIFGLGKSLNLKVVAEGVENEKQLSFLRENGCFAAQGYVLGQPTTAIESQIRDKPHNI